MTGKIPEFTNKNAQQVESDSKQPKVYVPQEILDIVDEFSSEAPVQKYRDPFAALAEPATPYIKANAAIKAAKTYGSSEASEAEKEAAMQEYLQYVPISQQAQARARIQTAAKALTPK